MSRRAPTIHNRPPIQACRQACMPSPMNHTRPHTHNKEGVLCQDWDPPGKAHCLHVDIADYKSGRIFGRKHLKFDKTTGVVYKNGHKVGSDGISPKNGRPKIIKRHPRGRPRGQPFTYNHVPKPLPDRKNLVRVCKLIFLMRRALT